MGFAVCSEGYFRYFGNLNVPSTDSSVVLCLVIETNCDVGMLSYKIMSTLMQKKGMR